MEKEKLLNSKNKSMSKYPHTQFEGNDNLKIGLKKAQRFTIVVFILGGLLVPIKSFGSTYEKQKNFSEKNLHRYSEKECLALTTQDKTYIGVTKRISNLKTFIEFNSLLKKNKVDKVSIIFFFNETRYINDECFWYIRAEEDHQTHLVFWKAFLAEIEGNKIYEEDQENDSYHIVK